MPVLARALVAAIVLATAGLTGCYDPALRDCTVTCAGPGQCAEGQVCGDDGFCASPELAGTCGEAPGVDGGIDAPSGFTLRLQIEKKGRLVLADPASTCESSGGGGTTCTIALPGPRWVDLQAIETDRDFERWTTPNCVGVAPTCRAFAGLGTTTIGARFH